jgi:hypothetical protein
VSERRTLQGRTNTAPPWEPAETDYAEVSAIQALIRGDASHDQQLVLVRWIEKATACDELEFRASGERESNFAAGKRFVGLQFFTLGKTILPDPRRR